MLEQPRTLVIHFAPKPAITASVMNYLRRMRPLVVPLCELYREYVYPLQYQSELLAVHARERHCKRFARSHLHDLQGSVHYILINAITANLVRQLKSN